MGRRDVAGYDLAAMGPQTGGGLITLMLGIGIGIALSFLTLPLWYLGLALV